MNGPQYVVSDIDLLIQNGFTWRVEWAETLTAGATSMMGISTGQFGAVILDRSFFTDGTDTLFSLYRGTTFTGGTPLTPKNRNDRFWGDSDRLFGSTFSGVSATLLESNRMGSVRLFTAGPKTATFYGQGTAVVLKPNSSYVVSVTNNGVGVSSDVFAMLVSQDRVSSGRFVFSGV